MRGMLLKDFYIMRGYLRMLSFMFLFYLGFGLISRNSGVFAAFVGTLCILMTLSSCSYDQACGWDAYGASLPVSRREMVGAKYLLVLTFTAVGALVTLLAQLLFVLAGRGGTLSGVLPTALGAGASGLLLLILVLPLIYRFGVEKGRLALLLFVGVVMVGGFAAVQLKMHANFTERGMTMALYALPVLLLIGLGVSYRLSCRFFERKEL